MDALLTELASPQAVIGITAAVFLMFLEPVITRIRNGLWRLLKLTPKLASRTFRAFRYRYLLKLKKVRRDPLEITYQIARTNTYFLLFWGAVAFYLALIVLGPLSGIGGLPTSVQLVVSAPIYIFELVWLIQDDHAKELIKSAAKIRVKNRSALSNTRSAKNDLESE